MRNKIFVVVFLFITFFAFSEQADAAALRMKPSQAEVTVGNIVRIQVAVDTQGKVINNTESVVQFPTDLLEVVSLDSASSIFSLWVENPSFSNTTGQVTFNGGVPNPGFQGSSGNIVSIVFRAKKAGTASVLFLNSAVRENDGLGTDILTETSASTITIRAPQTTPAPSSGFKITSSTHTNESAWYNTNNVVLSWTLPENATAVRTLLSESSNSVPNIYYDRPITSKNITDIEDGIWYFHIQYFADGAWSSVQRHKIQIDTTPPTNLSVRSEKNEVGKITLYMGANDSLSGIDKFTVTVDSEKPIEVPLTKENNRILNIGTALKSSETNEISLDVPFTRVGEHTLTIAVVDKAGNKTETKETVTVDRVPELRIDSFPSSLNVNENIEISGTAPYPLATLQVSLKDSTGVVRVFTLKSNSYSKFDFVSEPIRTEGVYTVWVDLLGDDDEILLTSREIEVLVKTPLVLQVGSYTIGLMKVLIPAALLVILFLSIILYGWIRFFALFRRVRKESREAEAVSEKAFTVLRTGVDRHMAKLKKVNRKLTAEEIAFLEEFSERLEEAEKLVTKEIKDITKL
ncbi:MAG: cohesin domain-containing protein [Patescibacteria group bacterium]